MYITVYRVRLCHCFQAFPCPGLIHGAETNKLAAVLFFSSNRAGKTEMLLHLVLAAQYTNTDNTPGSPASAFHAEPRKQRSYEGILCAVAFPWPLSDHSSHCVLDIYFFALANSRGVGEGWGWTSLSQMDKLKSGWGGGYARPVQNPPAGPCQNIPALASCLRLQ